MPKENKIDYSLFIRVMGLAKPYRRTFLFAALLAIVMAPVSILQPYLVNVMVDDYIVVGDIEGLKYMAGIFVLVLLLNGILRYTFIYSTSWLGQSIIKRLRIRVFNHISSLRLSYFDKTPIGTSTTRTINDIETINMVFSEGLITIISDILTLIAVLSIMAYTSVELTLICLITSPFLAIGTYIFKEKVKAAFQIVRTQVANMNAFLQERITGMRIVQIFNAEAQELNKFKAINRTHTQANLDSILYYAIFFPSIEVIAAIAVGLMVWWGALGVPKGTVTIGALIAFPIYLSMLFRPMRMLADKFNTLQMGLVAAQRVFDILDTNQKIPNNGHIKPAKLKGHIIFENVWFAYNLKNYVLKDINFHIQPSETLAIVGSTGSGKTTIINILSRFYEIEKGQITIDGINLHQYKLHALRSHIAIVLQDVFLFSGSVLDNLTLRNPHISEEQAIQAAKMIGAHTFIEQLPGGYHYQVMERGATLSTGQRQLISFARALAFDPDILILDEATSSIDPETEAIIQHAIEKLITKRTSIIIAHRLSTIKHADKILVLDKGEAKEFGTHEELIQIPKGIYQKLYNMQFVLSSK